MASSSSVSYVRVPDWSAPVRYGLAVGLAAAAMGLRGMLTVAWGHEIPFLAFFPAVLISAWVGGFGPGILTTALCAAAATYLWLPPFYSFTVGKLGDIIALAIFVAVGVLVGLLSE